MPQWLDALREQELLGLPILWSAEGEIVEQADMPLSSLQRDQITAIFAAHQDEKPFTVGPSLPGLPAPPVAEPSSETPRAAEGPPDRPE